MVEPSETAVKEFQDLVRNKYGPVEFRWFCMTWQDFQDKEWKKQDGSQYNIIHFVHSVYYVSSTVDELEDRMHRCYAEMLNAGGGIVIFAGDKKRQKYFFWLENVDKQFTWDFTLEMVLKIAIEEKWKFEVEELNSELDLAKCFDEESVEGHFG